MMLAAQFASLAALALKFVVLPIVLIAACLRPWRPPQMLAAPARWFCRAAQYPKACVFGVGAAAWLLGLCLSLVREPQPYFHDEFSYLLAADTYAHGRLTNAAHPHWRHFETFQVLHQPTYASIYPPVQGLMLALGQATTGRPIAGIWLLQGLAAAAVCWMLQGWVPARWALCGGLLVVVHAGIQLSWGQSYWGGSHALFGSALVYGALPRLRKRPTIGASLLLGLGAAVLANSRPYEGFVICIPAAIAVAWQTCVCLRHGRVGDAARIVLPAAAVLGLTVCGMAYYFSVVTGDPTLMPYELVFHRYYATSMFLGRPLPPEPTYSHDDLRTYFLGWAKDSIVGESVWSEFLRRKAKRLLIVGWFFTSLYLLLPAVLGGGLLRRREVRFAVAALAFALVAELQVPHWQPHYLAPAAPLLLLLIVFGLRKLHAWRRGGEVQSGRTMTYALLTLFALDFACSIALQTTMPPNPFADSRAQIVQTLAKTSPGKHLIIVRYGPNHSVHEDWVYNAADIDGSPVVWARDFGPDNQKLIDYYADRRVWLLEADEGLPKLLAYRQAAESTQPLAKK